MDRLKALWAEIKAALTRGGSGAARREADQEIVRKSAQGMRMAQEMQVANEADFRRHSEEWNGAPPVPSTPREDPHHKSKARNGKIAEWFLFALKLVFWVVFGPAYFAVLAWIAVVIALGISIPLGLGVKPLIAGLILKPGLTPQEKERRLHGHVIGAVIAFVISFGGLFLLRGLAGALAKVGALFVLPVLSLCDLVALYMMGVASAQAQLYSWAAPFVKNHHEFGASFGEFENQNEAARRRLGEDEQDGAAAVPAQPRPLPPGPGTNTAVVPADPQNPPRNINGPAAAAIALVAVGLSFAHPAVAQVRTARMPAADIGSELRLDSTTSLYPSIASTITPVLATSFYGWSEQVGARRIRVSTFERDGWLPRPVAQTAMKDLSNACAPSNGGEKTIFRGMAEALAKDADDACRQAMGAEFDRIQAEILTALTKAFHAEPPADPKKRSCTAFNDALASAARTPAGHLLTLVSDTEETCKADVIAIPEHGSGGYVVVVLLPSKTDMGPGVSASARFAAKKAHVLKIAPWVTAVLAPADVENYRLPIAEAPMMKVTLARQQ
jgi:hypothetical protein